MSAGVPAGRVVVVPAGICVASQSLVNSTEVTLCIEYIHSPSGWLEIQQPFCVPTNSSSRRAGSLHYRLGFSPDAGVQLCAGRFAETDKGLLGKVEPLAAPMQNAPATLQFAAAQWQRRERPCFYLCSGNPAGKNADAQAEFDQFL